MHWRGNLRNLGAKMVAGYEIKLSNRFDVLATIDPEELENPAYSINVDKKSSSDKKCKMDEAKGAWKPKSKYRSRQDEVKMETSNSKFDRDIEMSIKSINVLYLKTKTQILLLEWLILNNVDFQNMANKMPETESMSLLEEPSQDEGGQKEFECPAKNCNKTYRFKKTLENHVKKHHDSELEESFNPPEASTQDDSDVFMTPCSSGMRKRKTRDDDDSDGEGGEKEKAKRLDSIREEESDNLGSDDFRLLDDSVEVANTQDVHLAMKAALEEAEKAEVEVDVEELDESLRREEAMDMEVMKKKLKTKDDLLHVRNATLAEQEAEIGELKIVKDQLTSSIKKVRGERDDMKKMAKKELEEKEEKIKEMMSKINEMSKRGASPGKEAMKEDMEKATEKMKTMANRINNLSKDLKNANKDRRKAEVDNSSYEKMKASLERTTLEMEDIKRDMETYKREVAKANKKIPCQKKECNNPRDCEFSHHLRYEIRSEPKEEKWEKRVPCRFQSYPGGCFKTAEECKFLHTDGGAAGRREGGRDLSVEIISEAGPSWAVHTREGTGRRPPMKKMRASQGNERGVGEVPSQPAPERMRTMSSRRNSATSSVNSGGPARMRGESRSRTPRTPTTREERRWTKSRSRSNSRERRQNPRGMGQVPPRHQVQDPRTARPRSDRDQERQEYSRQDQGPPRSRPERDQERMEYPRQRYQGRK